MPAIIQEPVLAPSFSFHTFALLMKTYRGIPEIPHIPHAVVTTGTFDGVHPGHRSILERLNKRAGEIGGESVLITFDPHPRTVIHPDSANLKLLNTQAEKEALLAETGLDHLIVIPFTKAFSQITAEEYIRSVLVEKIGVEKLVIGYDHRFGHGRGGSFRELKEMSPSLGFEVEEIPALEIEGVAVSSTKIRQALMAGDVKKAAEKLGYLYAVSGLVVKGDQIGRSLGFPTANLQVNDLQKLVPADGIYAVWVDTDRSTHKGMLHIGPRRTLNSDEKRIEVNLFDFSDDLYGNIIRLRFIDRLRGEEKFNSQADLTEQMKNDKLQTERIFENLEK